LFICFKVFNSNWKIVAKGDGCVLRFLATSHEDHK
jgi:hypothetical protein